MLTLGIPTACQGPKNKVKEEHPKIGMSKEQAEHLSLLPLDCIQKEYPNKLNQVLSDSDQLRQPSDLHPSFYGCFDWHSAVHAHWSLVKLITRFPNMHNALQIKSLLRIQLSQDKLLGEKAYFDRPENATYERTYGWAWFLKLSVALDAWPDPLSDSLLQNMQPLAMYFEKAYLDFLPKLKYPIRAGEHNNTAFGLSFAHDYAKRFNRDKLRKAIEEKCIAFYAFDQDCPIKWEPSGFDFLSPCLQEADIMSRVLNKKDFKFWFQRFLPDLVHASYRLAPGEVLDRRDGKLVHLDGLNFSRAWCLYRIAHILSEYDHLRDIADAHLQYSYPSLVDGSYEASHWLASFAIYAMDQSNMEEENE